MGKFRELLNYCQVIRNEIIDEVIEN